MFRLKLLKLACLFHYLAFRRQTNKNVNFATEWNPCLTSVLLCIVFAMSMTLYSFVLYCMMHLTNFETDLILLHSRATLVFHFIDI